MIQRGSTLVLAVLLAAVPALAACGSRGDVAGGETPGLARNAVPGLVGRSCEFASDHRDLPSFADLARVGTRGNIGLWGADMTPADSAVLSVRYGEDGRLVWVRAIQASIHPDRLAPLERLLLESLVEEGPADWGVRIRIAGGDLAGLDPSVLCPAEAGKGGPRTAVAGPVTMRDYRALSNARGRQFPVEISLDERGRILGVRLQRSSGEQVVDQFLRDWILATEFLPKLHDGIALASTLNETIYIPRRR